MDRPLIPYRNRRQLFIMNPQHGTGSDHIIAIVNCKKLQRRPCIGAFLYLIEKNQRLMLHKTNVSDIQRNLFIYLFCLK